MALERLICNLRPALRHETMEGRDYLVAPMVMLTEGVHAGSGGPVLYTQEELKKNLPIWNHKPVVIYHPKIEGQGVSACDPDVLTTHKVGVIMNARFDGKLRAEAWLEEHRLKEVDERVLTALEKGLMMEVSTGVFTNNEETSGEWNGEKYDAIATDLKADHLAILPDIKGACSIEDGAGLLQLNSTLSFDNIREGLRNALREKYSSPDVYCWVADVYEKFVVYECGSQLFRLDYSVAKDNTVALSGFPEEVVRVTEYRTVDGTFVGNAAVKSQKEEPMPTKAENIATLIKNDRQWKETDRKSLEALDEKFIERLVQNDTPAEPEEKDDKKKVVPPKAEEKPKKEPVVNQAPPKAPAPTFEEYVTNAPAEYQECIHEGMQSLNEQKELLVEAITNNEQNEYSKEELLTMKLADLKKLARLAAPQAVQQVAHRNNYGGAAPALNNNSAPKVDHLTLPSMTF